MKGISPLIAAVLLIAFTVSIATIIIGWFTTFVRTTTGNVTESTEETLGCSVASISIEHVYLNGTAGNGVVKSTGCKDFTKVSGMIVSSAGDICSTNPISLSNGSIGTLSNNSCSFICTNFERAFVITE